MERARRIYEVGPPRRDQRFAAVWENEEELQAVGHAGLPEDLQRSSFEWVMEASNGDPFRELPMMGSLSWFPSITFRTKS